MDGEDEPSPEFDLEYITAYCKAKDIVESARIDFFHAERFVVPYKEAYKKACMFLKAAKRVTKCAIKAVKIAKRNYDEMYVKATKASNSCIHFATEFEDSLSQSIAAIAAN